MDTFTVPSAGNDEAKQAFNYLAGDFEDALQISADVASKADHILTNDASGFTKSPISVLSPKELLLMLVSGDSPNQTLVTQILSAIESSGSGSYTQI